MKKKIVMTIVIILTLVLAILFGAISLTVGSVETDNPGDFYIAIVNPVEPLINPYPDEGDSWWAILLGRTTAWEEPDICLGIKRNKTIETQRYPHEFIPPEDMTLKLEETSCTGIVASKRYYSNY